MFGLLRTYLRYAGRIGWVDGRRGYPSEEQYQELHLHRALSAVATAQVVDAVAGEGGEQLKVPAQTRQAANTRS